MASADKKPVKIDEFTADAFVQPGEQILCAVIIGPDIDDPTHKTLHMRSHADAIAILRSLPLETRTMIVEHQERLMREFRGLLL